MTNSSIITCVGFLIASLPKEGEIPFMALAIKASSTRIMVAEVPAPLLADLLKFLVDEEILSERKVDKEPVNNLISFSEKSKKEISEIREKVLSSLPLTQKEVTTMLDGSYSSICIGRAMYEVKNEGLVRETNEVYECTKNLSK